MPLLPFVRRSRLEVARQLQIHAHIEHEVLIERLSELEHGIEAYLKVIPGRKGHGAARKELAELVRDEV